MKFNLFDTVKLKQPLPLSTGGTAPAATVGIIVEVFNHGEAYLVELFGDWVKYDEQETFIPATRQEPDSFRETIGVETVYPHQIYLIKPAHETIGVRAQLLTLMDELPEDTLKEVINFADFLKQKQRETQRSYQKPGF